MRRTSIPYGIVIPVLLVGGALLVALLSRSSSWFRAALLPPNNTQQIQDIYGNSVVSRVSLGYGDSVQVETGIQYLVHCPTDGAPSGYGFHSPVDFDVPGLRIYEYTAQQSDERDKAKSGKARWNGRTFGYDVNDDLDVFEQGKVYLVSAAEPFEFSCTGTGLGGGSSSSAGNSSSTGMSSSSSSAFVGQLSCTSPVVAITPAVIPDELYDAFPYLMPGHVVWDTQQNTALILTQFDQGKVWSFNPTTNVFTSRTFNTGAMPSGFTNMTIQSAVWNSVRNEAYVFMKSGTQTRMFQYAPSSGLPQDKGTLGASADVAVMDATSDSQKVYLYSRATGSFNAYDVLTSTFIDMNNTLPQNGAYYDDLKDHVTSAALNPEDHSIYFTTSAIKNTGGNWTQEDMYIYKFTPEDDSTVQFPQLLTNNALETSGGGSNLVRTAPPRNQGTIVWNEHTQSLLILGGFKETAFDTSMVLQVSGLATAYEPRIRYDILEFDPARGTISPRPEILPSARHDIAAVWSPQHEMFFLFGGGTGVETAPAYVTTEAWSNNGGFLNGSLLPATPPIPDVEHQVVTARICTVEQNPSLACARYNLSPQITMKSNGSLLDSPLIHVSGNMFKATDTENDPVTFFLALSAPKFSAGGGGGNANIPILVNANPYDVNSDSMVDIGDVNAIGSLIGLQQGQPGYNHLADINDDGSISQADVTAFLTETAAAVQQMFGDEFSFNSSTGEITNPITPICQGNVCLTPISVKVTMSAYTPAPCYPLRYSSLQFSLPKKGGG